jgi:hypothetical protein
VAWVTEIGVIPNSPNSPFAGLALFQALQLVKQSSNVFALVKGKATELETWLGEGIGKRQANCKN